MSRYLVPMRPRNAAEAHRASSPLELFFDLTVVVAVSLAAVGLAHALEDGHTGGGLLRFAMVFFALFWAWLNFTWFASAYDTDDWLYRVVTIVQMGGALTIAAGIPRVFDDENVSVVVVGYVIMRLAMVFQWLRATRNDVDHRRTTIGYAAGVSLVQLLWVLRLLLIPDVAPGLTFLVLVLAELAVPALAERASTTSYHPGHIAERYGLFTLIVLGEGVLASADSVIEGLDAGEHTTELVTLAFAALVLLAGMWWVYFASEPTVQLRRPATAFVFGYGHYGVLAAAAAVSAGIEVEVAAVAHLGHVSRLTANLTVAVAVALYVVLVWALVLLPTARRIVNVVLPLSGVLCVLAGLLPLNPPALMIVEAVLVALAVGALVLSRPLTPQVIG